MAAGVPFTGKSMTLKTGATPTALDHVGSWELTIGGASGKYATNSTGGWRKTTVGVGEWSGKMTIMLHDGGAQPLARGDEVFAQFHADSDDYISGTIVITEVGPITLDARWMALLTVRAIQLIHKKLINSSLEHEVLLLRRAHLM